MATSFALWHCQLLRFFVFFCWLTIFRRFIQCWACRLPFFKACLNPVEEQDSCSHWQRYFNQRNDGVLLRVIMAKWPLITLIRPPKFYRSILLLFFLLWGRRSIVISYSNIWYKGTRSFLKGVGATSKFGQLQEVGQLHFKKFATSCREMLNLIIT